MLVINNHALPEGPQGPIRFVQGQIFTQLLGAAKFVESPFSLSTRLNEQ